MTATQPSASQPDGLAEVMFEAAIRHQRIPTYKGAGQRCTGCDNLKDETDGANSPRHVQHVAEVQAAAVRAHLADLLTGQDAVDLVTTAVRRASYDVRRQDQSRNEARACAALAAVASLLRGAE